MADNEPAPTRVPWTPLIAIITIAASVALDAFYPLPWFGAPFGDFLFALGWLLILGFVVLVVTAVRALHHEGTAISPTRPSEALVTGGPFAFSRNPIYLGILMLLVGVGLVQHNGWFVILAIAAGFSIGKLAIEPEERHLERRFGRKYRDYRKTARRWF